MKLEKGSIGGLLSKILGAGVKETVDSIGNAIDKIDKSDEKLELQLKYKELLLNMEGACIDYESKLRRTRRKSLNQKQRGRVGFRETGDRTYCICMFIVFNNYVVRTSIYQ
ncbi:MAG: hypothetical protein IPJ20_08230 [Flammeovirgaceae bacterium]|nr:hypothetical protein [Flammeovirgaceae bacterium]